jgi:prophage antirepressor-like protein
MSQVVPLEFVFSAKHKMRVIMRNNEPWFVTKDVCEVLEIANSRHACLRLDDDEKDGVVLNDIIGREQKTSVVNESGLYSLVFSSRKSIAKDFKRWLSHDVIPSIRKTGAYVMPGATSISPMADGEYLKNRINSADTTNDLHEVMKRMIPRAGRDVYVRVQGAISDAIMGMWPGAYRSANNIPGKYNAPDFMTKPQLAFRYGLQQDFIVELTKPGNPYAGSDGQAFADFVTLKCDSFKHCLQNFHGQHQEPTELLNVRRAHAAPVTITYNTHCNIIGGSSSCTTMSFS